MNMYISIYIYIDIRMRVCGDMVLRNPAKLKAGYPIDALYKERFVRERARRLQNEILLEALTSMG